MGNITSVRFGSARSSYGNQAVGDQRQKSDTNDDYGEVSMQQGYTNMHGAPYIYRLTNADYATKAAQCMITFCNNRNVGYSMTNQRTGVVKYGPNTTTKTNGDCSATVRACIKYSTGKDPGDFYTGDEGSVLSKSGLFTYMGRSTSATVYNGDVLYGRSGSSGHTVIVVKGNPREGQAETELAGATYDSNSAYDSAIYSFDRNKIDTSVLDQYVLIIDRNTSNPDYATWKKKRVAGVIIEAGYLYSSSHTLQSNPRNPYIDDMCKNAAKAGMPFGLYWNIQATTETEAKQELYQLQFLIRKYPPTLGMWVHVNSSNSKTTNDNVIKIYDQEFEILGLKNNRGFWVTNDELAKLSWSKWYETWWLLLNKHLTKSIEDLSGLLDPEFFEVSQENQVLKKEYRQLITDDSYGGSDSASTGVEGGASGGKFESFPLAKGTSYRISSLFGKRSSPGGIGSTNHKGIDLACNKDSKICAARAGKVTGASNTSGGGNTITIDHGGGIVTKYMHQHYFAVSKGQTVSAGQVIGYVDSTGNSTGNHLHFQVEVNGTPEDPRPWIGLSGKSKGYSSKA